MKNYKKSFQFKIDQIKFIMTSIINYFTGFSVNVDQGWTNPVESGPGSTDSFSIRFNSASYPSQFQFSVFVYDSRVGPTVGSSRSNRSVRPSRTDMYHVV